MEFYLLSKDAFDQNKMSILCFRALNLKVTGHKSALVIPVFRSGSDF